MLWIFRPNRWTLYGSIPITIFYFLQCSGAPTTPEHLVGHICNSIISCSLVIDACFGIRRLDWPEKVIAWAWLVIMALYTVTVIYDVTQRHNFANR